MTPAPSPNRDEIGCRVETLEQRMKELERHMRTVAEAVMFLLEAYVEEKPKEAVTKET